MKSLFFSTKPRRRRNGTRVITRQVEIVEDRKLLSAVSGLVDDHGNSASSATDVSADSTTDGNLEQRRDVDLFAVAVESGTEYTFETHLQSLRDSVLHLQDANGSRIAYNDDGGRGLASKITWTADRTGTVFLKVASYASRYSGAYRLNVSENTVAADDHSNSASGATAISAGVVADGNIETGRDVDVFKLTTEANTDYVFSTTLGSLRDSVIELRDADGNRLGHNDDGGVGLASRLEWSAESSGDVFLHVRAYSSRQTGTFQVRVTAQAAPVDDHGNSSSAATAVATRSQTAGNIEQGADHDWFRIDATRGQRFEISTALGTLRDSVIAVYNADGERVAYNDDYRGLASRVVVTAQADGPLFIDVRGYSRSQTGTYTLNVEPLSDGETEESVATVTRTRRRIVIPRFRRIRYWY
jgi:hypothetical protein